MKKDVVIVGAGLAGLAAANTLALAGIDYRLIEAAPKVGGRVATETQDGFILDKGFQIFLTAYPEAEKLLDYPALNLQPFYKGALIWDGRRFAKVADPFQHPLDALCSLINDIGTPADKLRVARLRQTIENPENQNRKNPNHPFETTTLAYLEAEGFSQQMIERLFRPFFSGIFLERTLATSSRLFTFLFRMFAYGEATLPANGMQAIPQQLADCLETGRLHLSTQVDAIQPTESGSRLLVSGGELIEASIVLVCTDARQARMLLPQIPERQFNATCCLYFEMPSQPIELPILMLNSVPNQIINNLCVPSLVSPHYAPAGKHLLSVSTVGQTERSDEDLEIQVRRELTEMFGSPVKQWRLLKIDKIPYALPRNYCGELPLTPMSAYVSDGIFMAGDHCDTPSINGALASGRRAAEEIIQTLRRQGG